MHKYHKVIVDTSISRVTKDKENGIIYTPVGASFGWPRVETVELKLDRALNNGEITWLRCAVFTRLKPKDVDKDK